MRFLWENHRRKGNNMKKRTFGRVTQAVLALVLVAALALGIAVLPQTAKASAYEASSIKMRDDVAVNYMDYVDSSVMFQLPDTIKNDDEISVIITVGVPSLMDAYDEGAKTMSFSEYALHSDDGALLKGEKT